MKNIKNFENWTTNVAGDYIVNYDDKPVLSEIVEYTKQYIEDNFDTIERITNRKIEFCQKKESILKEIEIEIDPNSEDEYPIYSLKFTYIANKWSNDIDITEEEYNYLSDFLYEINKKFRNKYQKFTSDKIKSNIDPIRRAAKKYNL